MHAILRNPYQAEGGRHHAGNKMAIANMRERLALHFDAEGALESRVAKDAYEVHLRMPYRTASPVRARRRRRRGARGDRDRATPASEPRGRARPALRAASREVAHG